jgi:hypothetical protein
MDRMVPETEREALALIREEVHSDLGRGKLLVCLLAAAMATGADDIDIAASMGAATIEAFNVYASLMLKLSNLKTRAEMRENNEPSVRVEQTEKE